MTDDIWVKVRREDMPILLAFVHFLRGLNREKAARKETT